MTVHDSPGPAPVPPPRAPSAVALTRVQRQAMLAAGREIGECYRVLGKCGLNIVGEVLKGQPPFVEFDH